MAGPCLKMPIKPKMANTQQIEEQKPMWNALTIEKPSCHKSTLEEIRAFEKQWNIQFPEDHKTFLTELGDGTVYNRFDIFGLDLIPRYTQEYCSRWANYYHWTSPQSALSHKELLQCVCVGETVSTDELVLSPNHPQTLFILPEIGNQITDMGNSLKKVMEQDIINLKKHIMKVAPEDWDSYEIKPVFQAIER